MSDIYTSARTMNVAFSLPDAITATESIFAEALAFCAGKMRLADVEAVRHLLCKGDATARGYFDYALVKGLAEHIGALDEEVQAIYLYNPEATVEDTVFGVAQPTMVHLLVWARRKTRALNALLSAVDRAVTDRYAEVCGATERASVLDAQVVDDVEVNARSGFGALLASLHNRPLMVWKR